MSDQDSKRGRGVSRGLRPLQLAREIDRILTKQAEGNEITRREQRILAYTVTAERCSCGVNRGQK